jgi:hypothetical protein
MSAAIPVIVARTPSAVEIAWNHSRFDFSPRAPDFGGLSVTGFTASHFARDPRPASERSLACAVAVAPLEIGENLRVSE